MNIKKNMAKAVSYWKLAVYMFGLFILVLGINATKLLQNMREIFM